MATQADELAFELGQAGLVSPCAAGQVDPPAHLYTGTQTVVAPQPVGTVLPIVVTTINNVTDFAFSAVKGDPGTGGGGSAGLTSLLLPGVTISKTTTNTTILPGKVYELEVYWPSGQGTFDPFPLAAYLDGFIGQGHQANRNDVGAGGYYYAWTFFTPPSPSSPYTAITLTIVGATLVGKYTGSATVTPTWQLKVVS